MYSRASTVDVKSELVVRSCRRRQHTELTPRRLSADLHGDKTQTDYNQKKVNLSDMTIIKYFKYCWGDFRDEKFIQTFYFSINSMHVCNERLIIGISLT
jgi:hypothetical protein